VTNGGFQNYLHLMYGLPNGFIKAKTQVDTSDILNRGLKKRRKRKTEEELLEEYLAAQILAGRKEEALAAKRAIEEALEQKNLKAEEKAKQTRFLMLFMLMDD
jgi:hypothetical protein